MIFGMEANIFIFLIICLILVVIFEFINWFNDTSNAIVPVVYTKSLKPRKAVLIAAVMNFFWVILGWIWVAMAIIHLLPLDAIWYQSTGFGVVVIISLLLSAIIWNFTTWSLALPSSSSHSLIWSILWVTFVMTLVPMKWGIEVKPNWDKAISVIEALLISPIIWFAMAFLVMTLSYKFIKSKYYFSVPSKKKKSSPKLWLRSLLIGTSAWVSFAHGSNDWQKWVWLAVLILVVLAPASFAVNPKIDIDSLKVNISHLENIIDNNINLSLLNHADATIIGDMKVKLNNLDTTISKHDRKVMDLREDVLAFQESIKKLKASETLKSNSNKAYSASIIDWKTINSNIKEALADNVDFNDNVSEISKVVDYAPWWIILMISTALWLGTMVWRKRIVKTIWEKIGNTSMNYAQATSSALITAVTISLASALHMPVSTTHILSSSVAGTMSSWPKASWVQWSTVRNILMAWILTLPVTIILSGTIFLIARYLFL